MIEIFEAKTYKILGITIKVQQPELIEPTYREIRQVLRKPRYFTKNIIIDYNYKTKLIFKRVSKRKLFTYIGFIITIVGLIPLSIGIVKYLNSCNYINECENDSKCIDSSSFIVFTSACQCLQGYNGTLCELCKLKMNKKIRFK